MRQLFELVKRWMNALGLTLGIVGVVLVWEYGWPQPSFEQGVALALESATMLPDGKTVAQHNAEKKHLEQHYKFMSTLGLALIVAGYLGQLVNECFSRKNS